MPTKSDKCKLLHCLESHIEPTIDRSSSAAHIIDLNIILQSLKANPVTYKEQAESVYHMPKYMIVSK